MKSKRLLAPVAALLVLQFAQGPTEAFDRESYEEPAGSSFSVLLNSTDKVYGISFESATRIKDVPVVGNYFVSLFENGISDALYSGLGMSVRLLPEWRVMPILGAGGSYNYCWSRSGKGSELVGIPAEVMSEDPGSESYFAAHIEAGLRVNVTKYMRFVEITGRYTWNLSEGDSHYWLVLLTTGVGR